MYYLHKTYMYIYDSKNNIIFLPTNFVSYEKVTAMWEVSCNFNLKNYSVLNQEEFEILKEII